jgi:perosamine synthetase
MIRLAMPSIEGDDLKAVRDALESGYLVQGRRVADFEETVAARAGAPFAVAVGNCTAALHLALLALGVKPGDIVMVTAYSWISTANVIELCGARPEFIDVDSVTFNMSPVRLKESLDRLMSSPSASGKVKAVLPVHVFGQMADLPPILGAAGAFSIPVIEDAACSLGASLHGRPSGSWGVMGCFSFHPRKAVTTGEGGVVVTGDPKLAATLRALRNHGLDPEAASPDFIMPGFNCRMTEFQAALGLTQMAKMDRILAARRRLAGNYDRLFSGTSLVRPSVKMEPESHVYQSYVLLLPESAAGGRDALIRRLRESGVETAIGTWHMPMTRYFRAKYGHRKGDFPVADGVFERALALPLFEKMTLDQQSEVAEKVLSAVRLM